MSLDYQKENYNKQFSHLLHQTNPSRSMIPNLLNLNYPDYPMIQSHNWPIKLIRLQNLTIILLILLSKSPLNNIKGNYLDKALLIQ